MTDLVHCTPWMQTYHPSVIRKCIILYKFLFFCSDPNPKLQSKPVLFCTQNLFKTPSNSLCDWKKAKRNFFWPALSGRRKVLMSPRFRLCDEVMFLSYFFFRWILFENFSYINILGSINFYFWNFWKRKCLDLSMQWIFPLSFASQCRCLCAWRRSPTIMLKKLKNYYKTPQTSKTPKYNFSCVV